MTHVDQGLLQALADDELQGGERERVERHVADCLPCRAELSELHAAARSLTAALAELDAAPAARDYGVGWPRRPAPARSAWRSLPRAAVLVLGFAAAASATLPGSPLRRWLEGADRGVASTASPPAPVAAPAPPAAVATAAEAAPEAGVSVMPLDGAVTIVLRGAMPGLRVRTVVTERELAGVYGTGEAASARFQTGPGRIEVTGARAGDLRIELPQGASSATVTVDGQEYLRKEGTRLNLAVGAESRTGAEVTFRVRP